VDYYSDFNSDYGEDVHFHPLEVSEHQILSTNQFQLFSMLYQLSHFLIIEPSLFLDEKIKMKYCPDIGLSFFCYSILSYI
jgi:hypothetical protein